MSVSELVNWFNNLPYEAKLYWCGRDTLDYNNLPWRRYHEYFNKLSRTYLTYKEACAFNPGLSWEEYVRSPDYELWVFHMRDAVHRSYEQQADRLAEEHAHGWARSPSLLTDNTEKC
jgi:hypothetical protein